MRLMDRAENLMMVKLRGLASIASQVLKQTEETIVEPNNEEIDCLKSVADWPSDSARTYSRESRAVRP